MEDWKSDKRRGSWKYLLPIDRKSQVVFLGGNVGEIISLSMSVEQVYVLTDNNYYYDIQKRLSSFNNINFIHYDNSKIIEKLDHLDILIIDTTFFQKLELTKLFHANIKKLSKARAILISFNRNIFSIKAFKSLRSSIKTIYKNKTKYIPLPSYQFYRLIIPAEIASVIVASFKLHTTIPLISRLKKKIITLVAEKKILPYVTHNFEISYRNGITHSLKQYFQNKLNVNDVQIAIYCGAMGNSSKATLQLMNSRGGVIGFAKIADNKIAASYLENEAQVLMKLKELSLKYGYVPTLIDYDVWEGHFVTIQNIPVKKLSFSGNSLTKTHINWLIDIHDITLIKKRITQTEFWSELSVRLESVSKYQYKKVLYNLFDSIRSTLENIILPFSLCHRDFVPWNTYKTREGLYVFDWEWAKFNYPPLFDCFHFIVQSRRLIKKDSMEKIYQNIFINNTKNNKMLLEISDLYEIEHRYLESLFLLYLLDRLFLDIENQNDHKPFQVWYPFLSRLIKNL